ncbi:MAG: hypothetical protein O2819_05240 [Planctomycetota bacterium]|nr:hypothetical protein [Planctomycetota bacterium]
MICATSGLLAIDITPPGEVAFDVASELLAIEIRALAEHMRAPS